MENHEIAGVFREIAVILELKGDNPFRVRAYQRAAQHIEGLPESLKDIAKKDALEEIPGIGKDLASKIKELVETGRSKYYRQLRSSLPSGLIDMLDIPGLGPKTVKLIHERRKISTIKALEKAARKGRLKSLPGIQEKTEENIIKGIALLQEGRARTPLPAAMAIADEFIAALRRLKQVKTIAACGSLRRRRETVRDIDILVSSKDPKKVIERFVGLKSVKEVITKGTTKSSILTKENMQVDIRVVENDSFGAALVYFTGSKDFNISLRRLALKKGYKINEYGVFKLTTTGEKKVAGASEEEIFDLFKMQHIIPTLREDRGEIPLALKHKLPKVVELSQIKGDLHVHSRYSDGTNTIAELAEAGRNRGYEYLAVCDHSQSLYVANGLDKKRLRTKIQEIRQVNKKFKDFQLLAGSEVDILSDGSLDYPEEILKELEIVVAAVHSGFKQTAKQLTARIISAIKNKHVNIIAHPTGRLFGVRKAYEIDFDQIFSACADHNVALELNAYPQRIDLSDSNCQKAKEKKVKISIDTDAHHREDLDAMQLGLWTAQRGWLEKDDVLNTMSLNKLQTWLKKK
ncbi:DNA polymerase/3'-5' exonuclease PolX [Candidatus Omnitrophota bacterium]